MEHHTHHHSAASKEELLALVKYMANHNISHTNELSALSSQLSFDPAAQALVEKAIAAYEEGNTALQQALSILE